MKTIHKVILVFSLVWVICTSGWANAEAYAPKLGYPINSRLIVPTCALDQEKQLYWFAVIVRHRFSIPLIYPEEQTRVYCYDKKVNNIGLELTSNQRIHTMVPSDKGMIFLREHYFFLDDEICNYDAHSKKVTNFRGPKTVGEILAVNEDLIYYQGSLAYDDTSIYAYNIKTKDIKMICNAAKTAYADGQKIYVTSKVQPGEIYIYDIETGDLIGFYTLITNAEILAIADGKAITTDGAIFFLDYNQPISSSIKLEGEKIDAGWIDEDHLVIFADGVLESYIISTKGIEQIFSLELDEGIRSINMLYNEILLFNKNEATIYIISADGKSKEAIILPVE